jgi:hypothetical protein
MKYCLILILMVLKETECQIEVQVPMDFLIFDNPYLIVNGGLLERVFNKDVCTLQQFRVGIKHSQTRCDMCLAPG